MGERLPPISPDDAKVLAEGGFAVQGSKILDHRGKLWHWFDYRIEAVVAIRAFRLGFEAGKIVGREEAAAAAAAEAAAAVDEEMENLRSIDEDMRLAIKDAVERRDV